MIRVGQQKFCAQIHSRSHSVKLFYGQLMLTQKLQRWFAEEEVWIKTTLGHNTALAGAHS